MIYVCTHTDFEVPYGIINDNYKIISNEILHNSYDVPVIYMNNKLLSMKRGYCEGAMIYDIYLHENEEWIGINHYRRYFSNLQLYTNTVSTPLSLNMNTHYYNCLHSNDLIEMEKIIFSYYPQYRMNYDKINVWYPCNMFYLNRDIFNKYCQFCFGVLDIFNEKFNINTDEDIINHVGANDNRARLQKYLMECLSTIFFIKEFDNGNNVNFANINLIQNPFTYNTQQNEQIKQALEAPYFNTSKSKFMFFPSDVYTDSIEPARVIMNWCKNNRKDDTVDISEYQYEYYTRYYLNWHHFTTKTHYNLVLPKVNDMFNFGFNIDDFNLIEYFDEDGNTHEKFDLSYLYPKKDKNFTIKNDTYEYNGNFDILMGLNNNNGMTKYHNLYKFPHECSMVINNSENNGRTLLISGDSQNIPDIPIYAYYYKKVIYLDNRKQTGGIDYKSENIDDVLFSMFEKFPIDKQLNHNFK